MGVSYDRVQADADLAGYGILIVGKKALSVRGHAPDIARVRDGLRVVMFEQELAVLEQRFGFRTVEYGLRRMFTRVAGHPVLDGLSDDHLRDWHGEATTVGPRITDGAWRARHSGLTVTRCGIELDRCWRCGCRGNVASVLIEKPARGDFLPIADGGFSLQYAPLMEYHEGSGLVLFCQADVTGRSQADPAAHRLVSNLLNYAGAFNPAPRRAALYVGDAAGRTYLEEAGISLKNYAGGALQPGQVLIAGPDSGSPLAAHKAAIADWLDRGGHVLAVGLDAGQANSFLPFNTQSEQTEHINTFFKPLGTSSLLAGVGSADVLVREPRAVALIAGGPTPLGNGVLAEATDAKVVFCQLAPWDYDYSKLYNLKRTYRRLSCVVSRVLGNMGVASATPFVARFSKGSGDSSSPWLDSFYLDKPEEMDDPYRYFRW